MYNKSHYQLLAPGLKKILGETLQPIDIAQEIFDKHFESVSSIAPAEGNSPVRLLTDVGNEAKCLPTLFPKGTEAGRSYQRTIQMDSSITMQGKHWL